MRVQGFLVAGIIGRLSDCYGRRSIIIAQKISSLLCLATLAFRTQLHNNLWFFIVNPQAIYQQLLVTFLTCPDTLLVTLQAFR